MHVQGGGGLPDLNSSVPICLFFVLFRTFPFFFASRLSRDSPDLSLFLFLATGKYGCRKVRVYPTECSEQLGRDPSKIGSSKSLVLKSFSGEGTLWDSHPDSLGYPCTLYAPTSPLPIFLGLTPTRNIPERVTALRKSSGPPQNPAEPPSENPSERQISSESLAEGFAPRMVPPEL